MDKETKQVAYLVIIGFFGVVAIISTAITLPVMVDYLVETYRRDRVLECIKTHPQPFTDASISVCEYLH